MCIIVFILYLYLYDVLYHNMYLYYASYTYMYVRVIGILLNARENKDYFYWLLYIILLLLLI